MVDYLMKTKSWTKYLLKTVWHFVHIGLPVVRIVRVRIGPLRLGKLKTRQWRYLTAQEVKELKQPVGRK
jgi:16S rRNA U516 pseudouridylate synthase RsuA-like enzyme